MSFTTYAIVYTLFGVAAAAAALAPWISADRVDEAASDQRSTFPDGGEMSWQPTPGRLPLVDGRVEGLAQVIARYPRTPALIRFPYARPLVCAAAFVRETVAAASASGRAVPFISDLALRGILHAQAVAFLGASPDSSWDVSVPGRTAHEESRWRAIPSQEGLGVGEVGTLVYQVCGMRRYVVASPAHAGALGVCDVLLGDGRRACRAGAGASAGDLQACFGAEFSFADLGPGNALWIPRHYAYGSNDRGGSFTVSKALGPSAGAGARAHAGAGLFSVWKT
jgi:hypothetical protein